MREVSFDILRQGSWDLWCWVCLIAAGTLAVHAVRRHGVGLLDARRAIAAIGVLGTALVLTLLRTPAVGLAWTALLLAGLSAHFYLDLAERLVPRRVAILLALRVAAVCVAVPMLFEPVLRITSSKAPDRPFLLLVDRSGSMSVPDVQNGPSRLQSLWQTIRPTLPQLERRYDVRAVAFANDATKLDRPDAVGTLQPGGEATSLAAAIAKARDDAPRDDAIVVLLSDGIDNTSPDLAAALATGGAKRPIHTVLVGSAAAEPASLVNVAVDRVEAADDFVVRSESVLRATIKSTALANRVVEVKLAEFNAQNQPVAGTEKSKTLVLQPTPDGQVVELTYRPTTPGVHKLAVWVDPVPGERTTADNRQELQGLALDPRVKVLYVEGRARPEYRELQRALARDGNLELSTLLRIQNERFAASGTVDGEPLRGMPATAEQWKKFDVIVLGDLDASFLPPAQQHAIEQAVRGGAGLLMIGGQNSFGPGGYKGTPIEQALPVAVGELSAAQEKTPFVPAFTPAGPAHPAMEGLSAWFGNGAGKAEKELPPLLGNVVVNAPKPGAEVLLTHQDRPGPDGQPQVVLAVQRYGEGRSAAFTADTTYRWYLPMRGLGQDSPYNRFWGQLVRWLAGADVKQRQRGAGVQALLDKGTYRLGESVRVRAFVRDEKGDATRYAQVSLKYSRPGGGDPKPLSLGPAESRIGMYEGTIAGADTGTWTVELVATKDGAELGKQTLTFTVLPPSDEMLRLAADEQTMSAIARATGGYSYPLAQWPQLLETLARAGGDDATVTQRTVPLHNFARAGLATIGVYPAWAATYDLPMQAALVVALLAAEWILRRRWQLP
jgi:uncharacterized membrane protein